MIPELSIVVPVYNEEDVLPLLAQRLRPVADQLGTMYEVLAVDDGSSDQSPAVLHRIHREWPELRILRLRANAGHQAAICAGLAHARGAYVVTLDADLQDPPEVLPAMLAAARQGADVVYGVRSDRSSDSMFKRLSAKGFYSVIRTISGTHAQVNAGDYRLMSRATVDAVNALPQRHQVLRFVVPALGFPSASVSYRRDERAAGRSKYPLSKMIRLSLDSVTGFSTAPLRAATWLGLAGGLVATATIAYALIAMAVGQALPGWTSTVVVVAGVGAVQLLCLGILGEYVGRMYAHLQARPTYFVAYDSLQDTSTTPA